jgi:aspartyl/asparaginyl beta-hydroxylase (cupin superfamily)
MFCQPSAFPFISLLEANWLTVRDELNALPSSSFEPWPERFVYEGTWNVFGLYAFGSKLAANCRLCPRTTELVEAIPGLVTAGFSWLAPKTHIRPHRGYSTSVLRCHLPLITPPGCALRVADETRAWQSGECFVFDDTSEHEAWNDSDEVRVVLLIDFLRNAIQPAVDTYT